MNTAILIVDFQKDFFDPTGIFGKKYIKPNKLVNNLKYLLKKSREKNIPIIWIKSVYGETSGKKYLEKPKGEKYKDIPLNNDYLSGTHSGKRKCCLRDNHLSQLYDINMKEEEDFLFEKKWYSAFTDTKLNDKLKELNISKLIITGVTANVCVQATATDAFFHGYDISIAKNCIDATTDKKLAEAIVNLSFFSEITNFPLSNNSYGEGDSYILYDILPDSLANDCFDKLKDEVSWENMYHNHKAAKRLVAIQGEKLETQPIYRFPSDNMMQMKYWSDTTYKIKEYLINFFGQNINHAKIQYYRDGSDSITKHSDKTLDIKMNTNIFNISFGTNRTFYLKHKKDKTEIKIVMPHNSIFVLGWKTNLLWYHYVNKEDTKLPRISIQFRNIATYLRQDGKVFGQGGQCKTEEELEECQYYNLDEGQKVQLIKAFSKENSLDFNWNREYGNGFNVLSLKN